jgi:hypothetical protein
LSARLLDGTRDVCRSHVLEKHKAKPAFPTNLNRSVVEPLAANLQVGAFWNAPDSTRMLSTARGHEFQSENVLRNGETALRCGGTGLMYWIVNHYY